MAMSAKARSYLHVTFVALYIFALLSIPSATLGQAQEMHVYYGYVPPSTSIGYVTELIDSETILYEVPPGHSILDIIGITDNTQVEIWDIYAMEKIHSVTVDRFEKEVYFIRDGTFFKIVASSRVAIMLSGGEHVHEGYEWTGGTVVALGGVGTFYPAVNGGFRGREFIFMVAPATSPTTQRKEQVGYNFLLMPLEGTEFTLSDRVNKFSTSESAKQRGTVSILFRSRLENETSWGSTGFTIGYDEVYRLTTSEDVMVSSAVVGDFIAVPAITGGYVGRLFYAPEHVTLQGIGLTGAFIVIPLEEGSIKVYNKEIEVVATHSFTAADIEDMNYWYHNLGVGRFELIVESTGDIVFMTGQTEGTEGVDFLGDDIAFLGSRPNQEIRFYAPTMAIVFAPEALMISIDGRAPVAMAKDDFMILEAGVHSVSADNHVIVEVLAAGLSWDGWGSYLIEPVDADVSFEVPEGFLSKPVDYTMYIATAAVIVIAVLALFVMRRRRVSRS